MPHTISDMATIALAATDGMLHFELAMACEVFVRDPSGLADPWYDLVVCGESPVRIGRFRMEPDDGLDRLARADTVIIPAVEDIDADVPPDLLDAVRAAHEVGARIVSLCTGAFVLAAAGVLDGLRATTHWAHTEALAARYPRVKVEPDVLYVDNGNVLASAGKAAAIDLCLHLIRRDHGADLANKVARRIVVPAHRDGGQAQFIERPVPALADDSLEPTRAWALERLGEPLTVAAMARHACVSERTFARRFVAETGTTPLQWLLHQRVLLARDRLETTLASVDQIAAECGFGTAANLRIHFRRVLATTPTAYRRTFAQNAA
jgi:transcriptional regulator GlxA family with amidase domain